MDLAQQCLDLRGVGCGMSSLGPPWLWLTAWMCGRQAVVDGVYLAHRRLALLAATVGGWVGRVRDLRSLECGLHSVGCGLGSSWV
eukprot:144254-Chlamydomonas_euryale.AAC.2